MPLNSVKQQGSQLVRFFEPMPESDLFLEMIRLWSDSLHFCQIFSLT